MLFSFCLIYSVEFLCCPVVHFSFCAFLYYEFLCYPVAVVLIETFLSGIVKFRIDPLSTFHSILQFKNCYNAVLHADMNAMGLHLVLVFLVLLHVVM